MRASESRTVEVPLAKRQGETATVRCRRASGEWTSWKRAEVEIASLNYIIGARRKWHRARRHSQCGWWQDMAYEPVSIMVYSLWL